MSSRSYYYTDPDKAPVLENCYLLDDVEQRDDWWRRLFPLRMTGEVSTFFGTLPADVRDAARQVLEIFSEDPKERPRDLYEIYRGTLHDRYRLDWWIVQHLVSAAQVRYETAKKQISDGKMFTRDLYAFKAAHDLFRLLELKWSYIKIEEPSEDRGYGSLPKRISR